MIRKMLLWWMLALAVVGAVPVAAADGPAGKLALVQSQQNQSGLTNANDRLGKLTPVNLVDLADPDVSPGSYIYSTGGLLPNSTSAGAVKYIVSGYIPTTSGAAYYKGDNDTQTAFYDANKVFIAGSYVLQGGFSVTAPSSPNVRFMRIGFPRSVMRTFRVNAIGATIQTIPAPLRWAPANPYNVGYLRKTRSVLAGRGQPTPVSAQAVLDLAGDSYTQDSRYYVQAATDKLVALYGDAGGGYSGAGWWGTANAPPYVSGGNQPIGIDGNARPDKYPVRVIGSPTSTYRNAPTPNISSVTMSTAGDALEFDFPASPVISSVNLYWVGTADCVDRYTFNGSTWTSVTQQGTVGNLGVTALTGFPSGVSGTLRVERVSGTCTVGGVDFKSAAPGVRVNKLGSSGSSIAQWRGQTASEWQKGITALSTGANATLFQYMDGPNSQAAGYNSVSYATFLSDFLPRVRAAVPTAELLLVSPPENGRTTNAYPILTYAREMAKFANTNNYAYLDLQPAFGDPGTATAEYGASGTWPLLDPSDGQNLHPGPTTGGPLIYSELLRTLIPAPVIGSNVLTGPWQHISGRANDNGIVSRRMAG